jgi:Holliday junction resolvasome RuvABC endonuclease subunit
MKVAGIDASSNKTGIAIFQDGKYIEHILIDCHKEKDVFVRIPMMANKICEYLNSIGDIDLIIMEKSVLKSNIDTVQKLSNIAGAIMLYAYQNNIEFKHPTPSEWRKKVGLQQSSKVKREVLKLEAIEAVKREYGIDVSDDEAESILAARSCFDLHKIDVKAEDVEDMCWGEIN